MVALLERVGMTAAMVTALSDAKVGNAGIVESIDLPESVSNYLAHLGFPSRHRRRGPAPRARR